MARKILSKLVFDSLARLSKGDFDDATQAAVFASGDVKPTAASVTAGSEALGWLLCDGRSVLRADYPDLFTALGGVSSPYGLPDGTHFNLPDYRGRGLVGVGTHTEVNALNKNDGLTVGSRKTKHRHGTDSQGSHSHGGATFDETQTHLHLPGANDFVVFSDAGGKPYQPNLTGTGNFDVVPFTAANNRGHQHPIGTDGAHTHAVGDGAGPLDASAYNTVNWLVKT